jgi:alpha-galactosidase
MKNHPCKIFSVPFNALTVLSLALLVGFRTSAAAVWLDQLDLSKTTQGWGEPGKDKSVGGNELSIGGEKFARGLGTHAESTLYIALHGDAQRFFAEVGVDDEVNGNSDASVTFSVVGDGKTLWRSGVMRAGEPAKKLDVDVAGVKTLILIVGDAGDGISYDHADWADAKFEVAGARPETVFAPREKAVILTPPAPPTPRINGAQVFGVRPHTPFLFTIAATGDRPMTFSADHLPDGLQLDPQTGRITGELDKKGDYLVTLHAKNRLGEASRQFKIVCGQEIGLTPAMGWNSWNCFASAVTAKDIKKAANAMVSSGLINHGWTYINIDDFWEVNPHRPNDPTLQGPERDADGNILPNPRFPDMKALADYVHNKGLKIGLYSSPGPWTCGGCVASFDHELLDARQYAKWGFDYLKYDWCSYRPELEAHRKLSAAFVSTLTNWINSFPENRRDYMRPYAIMRAALNQQPRDIIFSFCQYGMGDVWEWGAQIGGNSWRTTGDIRDTWSSMCANGFGQSSISDQPFAGPGHFNDPDMLVVGYVGWGPDLHPTHLTPNEQYTHISLWCLLSAPLLIGCDMTKLDPFTLNLLDNDEVLAVDQDPLGQQAKRIVKDGDLEIWAKDMADGSKAVGLFNLGENEATVTLRWAELGLTGRQMVRDLWRQKNLGIFNQQFQARVGRHGVVLVKLTPAK